MKTLITAAAAAMLLVSANVAFAQQNNNNNNGVSKSNNNTDCTSVDPNQPNYNPTNPSLRCKQENGVTGQVDGSSAGDVTGSTDTPVDKRNNPDVPEAAQGN